MLFNSYSFLFAFLPVVLAGTWLIARFSHRHTVHWLAAASVAFYAVWDVRFVVLLLGSAAFNYYAGQRLSHEKASGDAKQARLTLGLAIAANLAVLGYFKYVNFFIATVNGLGAHWGALNVILPIGISFYTFTQIAYLVDIHRGNNPWEGRPATYLLFVSYFPHLVAGPLLHYKQVIPQFSQEGIFRPNLGNIAAGFGIFAVGLAKKVLIADALADQANPVFDFARESATLGGGPLFFDAWIGALSYTLQLYFDFSGYSDMAIGLSLMLNVRLPLNFNSPYKAMSIIEFWRRWHMTLSAFLRDYLYIPLGGNRKGPVRRYVNLMITMLLGGLWHGAGWTFVIWGGLHGLYLSINHVWRSLVKPRRSGWIAVLCSGALTFLAVVVAWVFFRADSLPAAKAVLAGMAGLNGAMAPASLAAVAAKLHVPVTVGGLTALMPAGGSDALMQVVLALAIAWLLPNTREMFSSIKPTWDDLQEQRGREHQTARWLAWRPTTAQALAFGALLSVCVFSLSRLSPFLYFQF